MGASLARTLARTGTWTTGKTDLLEVLSRTKVSQNLPHIPFMSWCVLAAISAQKCFLNFRVSNTFLRNHAKYTIGIDFLIVRTISFKALYVFVAISHDRRKILHFAVSSNPHSQWAIQQLRETFAFDETTKYVIRDNDGIYSPEFKRAIRRFGLKDTPTAPRSPWQNPFCERVIGTLRRECLDHMIILSEKHLYNVLHEYIFEYYNVSRTHMSLDKDSPEHRPIQKDGKIVSKPILGGLHHVYSRVAWTENLWIVLICQWIT